MPEKKIYHCRVELQTIFCTLPAQVTMWAFKATMREFYRQLKVGLVLLWFPEGFSRVILEAAGQRIHPAIANRTGGIS